MDESSDAKASHGRISERVRAVEPQGIREMFDLAAGQDGDLVHLEFGEPDFDTPAASKRSFSPSSRSPTRARRSSSRHPPGRT